MKIHTILVCATHFAHVKFHFIYLFINLELGYYFN
jgi:hypothetical protein